MNCLNHKSELFAQYSDEKNVADLNPLYPKLKIVSAKIFYFIYTLSCYSQLKLLCELLFFVPSALMG